MFIPDFSFLAIVQLRARIDVHSQGIKKKTHAEVFEYLLKYLLAIGELKKVRHRAKGIKKSSFLHSLVIYL